MEQGELLTPDWLKVKCSKCHEWKSRDEFVPDPRTKRGRRGECKKCRNARNRAWHASEAGQAYAQSEGRKAGQKEHDRKRFTPSLNRRNALKSLYNMTPDQYDNVLREQDGQCAICEAVPDAILQVDHCHDCGRVRGLLCHRCNSGKNWERIPNWGKKADAYLEGSCPCRWQPR